MMAFANDWGWASWLILGLIMLMFVIVVGGVGVMFWTAGREPQDPVGDEQGSTPAGRPAEVPPAS